MSISLDFSKLETWENLLQSNQKAACQRLCEDSPTSWDVEAWVIVSGLIDVLPLHQKQPAAYLCKCEKIGLKGWKITRLFKDCGNFNKFIKAIDLANPDTIANLQRKIHSLPNRSKIFEKESQ